MWDCRLFWIEDVDLKRSAAALLHRGPDMQGITSGRGWKIAFNRLAIIDVSDKGMQPFSFEWRHRDNERGDL